MVMGIINPNFSLAFLLGKENYHQDSWKWKGSNGSASLTHSHTQTQPAHELPAVLQDDDQGKKDGRRRRHISAGKQPIRGGQKGRILPCSHHHIPEEHILGGNSGISEVLPKFSNGETFISSKHV